VPSQIPLAFSVLVFYNYLFIFILICVLFEGPRRMNQLKGADVAVATNLEPVALLGTSGVNMSPAYRRSPLSLSYRLTMTPSAPKTGNRVNNWKVEEFRGDRKVMEKLRNFISC
jgi:hypothetical protein